MNRFRQFSIRTRSLDRAQAELWVLADAATVTPGTEIRGRLVGPTCPYSTTVEVAYPPRPFRDLPEGLPPLARRVVIPEPSYWDPVAPFLYHGVIELWQDDQLCSSVRVQHGLCSIQLGQNGLTWNGTSLRLSTVERPNLSLEELPALRKLGVNTLLIPPQSELLWGEALRLGFVVIGALTEPTPFLPERAESAACLGWLLPFGWWEERENWFPWITLAQKWRRYLGMEVPSAAAPVPPEVHFVIGPHNLPPMGRPRLLRPRPDAVPTEEPELGWVSC